MKLYKFVEPEKLTKESPAYEFAVYCRNSKALFKSMKPKGGSLSNPTAEFKFHTITHWDNLWYKYNLGDIVNLSLTNVTPIAQEPIKIKEMF